MTQTARLLSRWSLLGLVVVCLGGCGKSQVDEALTSDANGFLCLKCQTKFYTERKVFPTCCPACKKPDIEQVMGFVCDADKQMTLAPRSRGAVACSQCGKMNRALAIPRASDLIAWGGEKKSEMEVTGP
jgi:hypothetical protein